MGCDIHLYFEQKDSDNNWKRIFIPESLIPDDRNYSLFGFLAGVRNPHRRPLFSNRGIPKDTSFPSNNPDFWLGEHSFTYAYLDEILNAPWHENGLHNTYFYVFCAYVLPRLIDDGWGTLSKEEQRNIRVLIGFDN